MRALTPERATLRRSGGVAPPCGHEPAALSRLASAPHRGPLGRVQLRFPGSCAAWPRWRSTPAPIASWGAGGCCRCWRPTQRCLPASSPLTHADVEARRDRRRKLCVPCAALSQTLANIGVWCSQPIVQPRAMLRGRGTTPQHGNALDGHHLASVHKREQLVHRRTTRSNCARAPLKLTLPI